jgi:hypothetical protein
VNSPALGELAAAAMNVSGARLYMTSLFSKQPGDGASQWHKDIVRPIRRSLNRASPKA